MLMTVIIGSDPITIASLKQHLLTKFEMKDLGFLCYLLDIEVAYSLVAIFCLNKSTMLTFLIMPP